MYESVQIKTLAKHWLKQRFAKIFTELPTATAAAAASAIF